jgi:uncharacterized protein (DUF1330 family)
MIIESKVKDVEKYQQYISLVPVIVVKHGGRYLVRGGQIKTVIGDWRPERMIVLEFPSEANIQEWLSSPEYRAIEPLRNAGAEIQAVVIPGYNEEVR